ncbi:L-serine ammonia-lyase, iron-sulfur-dependent, subunit alpha [Halalkalibacterium halodurans]|jgi:L-serine dehydratase|uniref:L-serine dehydratase n=3 Tax=Halalkalibacterium halodurans TaxID=86665 RepID=Q9K9Z8_HALH5|nr:L-serine ammonia-lyase, iron-sulfur-dependent, subunit alpha [Halalkalibacterium halodurans]MDY7223042.1 L-serine ammonia-lyase, iron-sulfur-dependent, subunit alpha [Halalkalibacterium halodurans]MDY7242263.1 L-serine ammonia-lyase, iron-sulfur-dependent, subunit alpha [Halalkalibacterium halodurans]MED3646711.1 L-serine ammonia-lyase, iron-sulfur-dependent, subunit alpha [Halalkalibacterium halodurans]MED4081509.1 L-serine ammonia-lyase, iron-sulfur-dependent, subunit alpha [Halalkalibacte
MFRNVAELVELAESQAIPISEVMIRQEIEVTERSREAIIEQMENHLDVMEKAVRRGITEQVRSVSGLTGGDAVLLQDYLKKGNYLSSETVLDAVSKAVATNEVNAAMGTICATPTAGASGVVPGVLFGMEKRLSPTKEQKVRFLFTSGAFGFVVANNASISGAAGGCQAEVGSATGMAAAALVELAGGTPSQSAEAMAIALKNMLGLVCDPVAGLVEVPCVKRNAIGASIAITAADMALAGIQSRIPTDEVIDAMYKIGQAMPVAYKETAQGGLAATPKGRELEAKIFGVALDKK